MGWREAIPGWGSKTSRWHFRCSVSMCRNNSVKGKVIDKKWFIRIGCLWGLHTGGQGGTMSWELTGLQFYNQRKSGQGEKKFFVLSRCHSSIISSSSRLSRGISLPLYGLGRSTNYCFFMCVESMSWGSLTYWAGYGSHTTTVYSFGAYLVLLLHEFFC